MLQFRACGARRARCALLLLIFVLSCDDTQATTTDSDGRVYYYCSSAQRQAWPSAASTPIRGGTRGRSVTLILAAVAAAAQQRNVLLFSCCCCCAPSSQERPPRCERCPTPPLAAHACGPPLTRLRHTQAGARHAVSGGEGHRAPRLCSLALQPPTVTPGRPLLLLSAARSAAAPRRPSIPREKRHSQRFLPAEGRRVRTVEGTRHAQRAGTCPCAMTAAGPRSS